jgi:hypothetical protein
MTTKTMSSKSKLGYIPRISLKAKMSHLKKKTMFDIRMSSSNKVVGYHH